MHRHPGEVVIVGGGAGGAELAVRLARAGESAVRLIDQAATHVWKPRLHELAAGATRGALSEIAYRDLASRWGFVFEQATLVNIHSDEHRLALEDRSATAYERDYAVLVLALGGATPDMGVAGVAEHAAMLDRAEDAEALHARLSAARRTVSGDTHAARVVIVGSGLTGVELAGYLASREDRARLDIVLVEASERFMPALSDEAVRGDVRQRLEACGVTIRTGCRVARVSAEGLEIQDSPFLAADVVVWATGRIGPALAARTALSSNDCCQWQVRETLQCKDVADVFALGDCAAGPNENWPATAQVASQQAEHLAAQIAAYRDRRTLSPFVFHDKGILLSLGRRGGDIGLIRSPLSGSFRIQGHFSHAAYRGLERQHQYVLLGARRTLEGAALDVFERWIASRPAAG